MIKARTADALTVDELRALVRYCDNHNEGFWLPPSGALDLGQILALYHAAADAGWVSFQGWYDEDRAGALEAWNRIVNR